MTLQNNIDDEILRVREMGKAFFDHGMGKGNPLSVFVGITNMAFGCELGLKAILKKSGNVKRGHILQDLFLQLDSITQANIRAYYKEQIALHVEFTHKPQQEMFAQVRRTYDNSDYQYTPENFDFDFCICELGDALVSIRYMHEFSNLQRIVDKTSKYIPFLTIFGQAIFQELQ